MGVFWWHRLRVDTQMQVNHLFLVSSGANRNCNGKQEEVNPVGSFGYLEWIQWQEMCGEPEERCSCTKAKDGTVNEAFTSMREHGLQSMYYYPCITIVELLFPTKVCCPFLQYKPYKFGINCWIAADLESKHMCNRRKTLRNIFLTLQKQS